MTFGFVHTQKIAQFQGNYKILSYKNTNKYF